MAHALSIASVIAFGATDIITIIVGEA